ncbi:MAG: alpha/beta fold hydrolase [Acidimicrobiia bacterium]
MISAFSSRYVDVDGGPVHVADFGGDGPPVVCVHGLGGGHANWASAAAGLRKLGHVTALDLPGFGLTPPGDRGSLEGLRHAIDGYLKSLGQPAIVLGNSMGGTLSILQAAGSPETVRRLVLVSPAVPRPDGMWPDTEVMLLFSLYAVPGLARLAMAARKAVMTPPEIARWTLDLCSARAARIAPDVFDLHVDVARQRTDFPGVDRAQVKIARSLLALLARKADYDRAVATITAPTLIIQGRQDRLVQYQSTLRLASLRPDWEVELLDDVGHIAMLEVPVAFSNLVVGWASRDQAA